MRAANGNTHCGLRHPEAVPAQSQVPSPESLDRRCLFGLLLPVPSAPLPSDFQTALDLLSLRMEKSKVQVVRDLQPDLPLTLAHPGRLEQVVHNLVNNALDAMPDGGTLTLRTSSDGRSIVMEVEDTGVGIPQELLARVQEPFYTSKGHGTGLGLSVVRSIVWEHNGHMSMESQVRVGTTVRIVIPIRTALAPSEEAV